MEDKHTLETILESKVIEIPIEKFEEELNLEGVKEKKEKIHEVFTSFNKLHSQEEYDEIKDNLHEACREGDVELIQIYLNSTISNETKSAKFKIDETNHTASLFKVNTYSEEFIVPRTIEHDSVEYLITSITGINSNIKTLKFEENSLVKTIYGFVFSNSEIKEIYFPPSLKELKTGWCCSANKLTKIVISPFNGQFKFIDDQYLIGKSDLSNEEFDTLLFVRRDIKEISIPSNIKIISSYAFDNCKNLTKVEFETNSNLQTIGSNAFSSTKIEEIFIPPKVSKICKRAFFCCFNLNKILISPNSNLQTIESNAFYHTRIEEIYFPPSLKELKEGWCYGTDKLTKIKISPSNSQFKFIDDQYLIGKSDSSSDEFDTLLFGIRNIKEISIPSNIKIISSYAFYYCENLRKVLISTNSNLQTIESNAFSYSKIEEIFIPSKVSKICKSAFYFCFYLNKILIPTNSNLQTIESSAFSYTRIKEIFIPSKVSKICKSAFYNCFNLIKVLIPTNSNLQTIESDAFSSTKIKEIFIPSKVSKICEEAFSYCKNLQIVEISEDSKLESFPLSSFNKCPEFMIMIPSSLKKLIQ